MISDSIENGTPAPEAEPQAKCKPAKQAKAAKSRGGPRRPLANPKPIALTRRPRSSR